MKKFFACLLVLALLTGLTGCHIHAFFPADCVDPEICSICGEIRGEALGHVGGLETTTQNATYVNPGIKSQLCVYCGTVLNAYEYSISIYENGLYLFDALQFAQRANNAFAAMGANLQAAMEDGTQFTTVALYNENGIAVHVRFFDSVPDLITAEGQLNATSAVLTVSTKDGPAALKSLVGGIMALNNAITAQEARDILVAAQTSGEVVTSGDLSYLWSDSAQTLYVSLGDVSALYQQLGTCFPFTLDEMITAFNKANASAGRELVKQDGGAAINILGQPLGTIVADSYGFFDTLRIEFDGVEHEEMNEEFLSTVMLMCEPLMQRLDENFTAEAFMNGKLEDFRTDEALQVSYQGNGVRFVLYSGIEYEQVFYEIVCQRLS